MESTRRPIMIGAGLAACILLAACTPAVSPSYESVDPFDKPIEPNGMGAQASQPASEGSLGAPEPLKGSGSVKLAVMEGQRLPASVEEAFHRYTGFTLEQKEVASASHILGLGVDAVIGLGANDLFEAGSALGTTPALDLVPEGTGVEGVASELAYGRDDVCVLADRGWMSANRRSMPSGIEILASADHAQLLAFPDPDHFSPSALFIAGARAKLGEGMGQWAFDMRAGGALIASQEEANSSWTALEPPQSDAQPSRPLMIASMSAIMRSTTNTGVEAAAQALAASCVQRYLYAAPAADAANEKGATSFMTWLLTWSGQHALAEAGVAYPLDPQAVENTPAHWFLTPKSDALILDETAIKNTGDALAQWDAASNG
ncbi:hypothetical protein JFX23_07540 [Schaalia cardiffensis]|uniref:hypothetical protein n=1 Tax=Schaalia cardiffensis TaxID=181487 RepID=UPI0018E833E8|nr:hypothetical protein [Schaalia cardiffensis]MBJ2329617.1 hypothetical protein [Schaalia cardiffensis]